MNPKYKQGARVGKWTITHCYYANSLNSWVYDLEIANGSQKLICTESTLDAIAIAINS